MKKETSFRVTQEEYTKIISKAEEFGLSPSQYSKMVVIRSLKD